MVLGPWCHDKYKLVVAANRDEFYQRPTAGRLLAGESPFWRVKMKHGGTWMGITINGRCHVTNFGILPTISQRLLPRELVQEYLESASNAQAICRIY